MKPSIRLGGEVVFADKRKSAFFLWVILTTLIGGRAAAAADLSRSPDFHRVFFADTSNGYALATTARSAMIFKTDDRGETWHSVYQTKTALYGIHFLTARDGWVVGAAGTILRTSDFGKTWDSIQSGVVRDLLAVTSDSAGRVFVVGQKSTVLSSNDKGETWTSHSLPVAVDLTGVTSVDSGVLLALARDRLFTSSDAGSTWTIHGPYRWDTFSGLAFKNEKIGFLTSGQLFRTEDGGNTITKLSVTRTEHVKQVRISDLGTFVLGGSAETGSTIHLPGEKLPSRSEILKTTNLGKRVEDHTASQR